MFFDFPVLPILLTIFVVTVGLPHGALDHLFARRLLSGRLGRWWWSPFLAFYIGLGMAVLAGWFHMPTLTIVLFFGLSAWHFGDDSTGVQPEKIVEGGMVIWVPLLFRPMEVAELLAWVIPDGTTENVRNAMMLGEPLFWSSAAFLIVRLFSEPSSAVVVRKLAFLTCFMVFPTLVSFIMYFCGWHSLRELCSLARQADPERPWIGLRRVLIEAAPTAILTVMATAILSIGLAEKRPAGPVMVQAVFLGLSAVAVPHILFQEIVRRRRVNPFQRESDS